MTYCITMALLRSQSHDLYDTMIRYDTAYLRALKSWRGGQLNLAHGTETKRKNNGKLKTKTE